MIENVDTKLRERTNSTKLECEREISINGLSRIQPFMSNLISDPDIALLNVSRIARYNVISQQAALFKNNRQINLFIKL